MNPNQLPVLVQLCQPLQLEEIKNLSELEKAIETRIRELIATDFNLLVSMLYQLDVSENKLRQHLPANSGEPTENIIAQLIIERQLEKIQLRSTFLNRQTDIPEDERW